MDVAPTGSMASPPLQLSPLRTISPLDGHQYILKDQSRHDMEVEIRIDDHTVSFVDPSLVVCVEASRLDYSGKQARRSYNNMTLYCTKIV